jgi:hypothetical protein
MILPGESAERYREGLRATIQELGAKTHLQIYIAEKIFQCLWWIRRYEVQKRSAIVNAMADTVIEYGTPAHKRLKITQLLESGLWDEPSMKKLLESQGHTQTSLLEGAMGRQQENIHKLDQQIALRVKTLTQLQQSYEALVNRSIVQERLKLQNDLLKRDLQAIDIPAVEQARASGRASANKPDSVV